MKYLAPIFTIVALAFSVLPSSAQILFTYSFENDGTGYNLPDPSSTPPWQNAVVVNNGGPTEIRAGSYTGQDGSNYLKINGNGGFEDNSTSITTVSGDAGNFANNTTYTLSLLIQSDFGGGNPDASQYSGIFSLVDGTTGLTIATSTINASTIADTNFNMYSLTFSTSSSSGIAGDAIEIRLTATQSAAAQNNQNVKFDNVVLSGVASVPEPSTFGLLGLGAVALVVSMRRRHSLI